MFPSQAFRKAKCIHVRIIITYRCKCQINKEPLSTLIQLIHDYEDHPPIAQLAPYFELPTPPALPSPVILLEYHHFSMLQLQHNSQAMVPTPRSDVDMQPPGSASGAGIGRGKPVPL